MSSAEMEQLLQAKTLAMHNNPTEMLPKVLETTASMYHNGNLSKLKLPLAKFFTQLVLDVVSMDSPIANTERPFIAAQYLPLLLAMAQSTADVLVYKNIVLIMCASYPLVLDLVAKTSNQEMFDQLCMLKKFVLSHWRTAYPLRATVDDETDVEQWLAQIDQNIGVKLATIKFISEVVLSQTKSPSGNEINSSTIPDNHPVLNKPALESEAKRLLDMLLNYLIEEQYMVSSVFIGIINSLSFVIKRRPQTTIRILSGLLRFNVDAKFPLEGKSDLNYKLSKRFVERAYKNFVQFGLKNQIITKSLSSGSGSSIYSKLTKISQTLHVIGEETKSKGILNFDPSKGNSKKTLSRQDKLKYISLWKRQLSALLSTLGVSTKTPTLVSAPATGSSTENMLDQLKILQKYTLNKASHQGNTFFNNSPKPISNTYSSVYSLMNSSNSNQDVTQLPNDILIKLSTEAILQMDTTKLITGLSIVASRYTDLMNTYINSVPSSSSSKRKSDDDDDGNDNEEVGNDGPTAKSKKIKIETEPLAEEPEEPEDDDRMQKMLQEEESAQEISGDANKSTSAMKEIAPPFEPDSLTQDEKLKYLSKLTKKLFELSSRQDTTREKSSSSSSILLDDDDSSSWLHVLIRLVTRGIEAQEASDLIREELLGFFIQDFEQRVSLIIEWLNEEWFFQTSLHQDPSNYKKWSLRVLESLGPFLENKHRRFFIRLMSELPSLQSDHLEALKPICLDPARSSLGFQTLKFLIMFRPPVQDTVRDLLHQLKQEDEGLHKQCDSLLDRLK
ncbi:CPA_1a_G0000270.mRNA.1.CDS.1 [Saccharomyces cerevisiae]|nr:CPA_1a_G0000270.mRNA.1.CDS.1 [Saccharomyces cerevisiae]CAI7124429.1 CPA_1a_G0000270.mRNA.1.CDS.1 [Saccharomyces cerevisiae]